MPTIENAGSTTGAPAGVGSVSNLQNQLIGNQSSGRKMPKPGEKNAPTFDPEKPEDLGRFFERMEDWFAEEGVTDDGEKKK